MYIYTGCSKKRREPGCSGTSLSSQHLGAEAGLLKFKASLGTIASPCLNKGGRRGPAKVCTRPAAMQFLQVFRIQG